MGIFDRFYYGKAGKADYTEDDLPANRLQLFWQVLRVRFWSMMRLNLLQMIFWIPLIMITAMTISVVLGMLNELYDQETVGEMLGSQMLSLLTTYCILLIPCILITGPSSAAAAFVARNWARDQHAFLWSDFKDAFKANWKQGLCASAISSVLPYLLLVGVSFYGQVAQEMPIAVAGQVLMITAGVIWALSLVFMYPLMVGYELRVGRLIRNSVLLAVGRLPFAAIIRIATLLPLLAGALVFFFGSIYGLLFVALYYLLIGFSLNRLVCASFANGVFDRYINPKIEGAPVKMGLRADDDGEDEEE